MNDLSLLIITPFRNEEQSIRKILDSVIKQTFHPVCWVLIDDNSNDESPSIIKEYASNYPFIHYCKVDEVSKVRSTGGNVVKVFNYGLEVAKGLGLSWDIVSKLDADLSIDNSDYFEFLMDKFKRFKQLGITSGVTYITDDRNEKKIESSHRWHTQGQTKFYRMTCLEAIGGLKPFKGWDGLDDILARDKGFITEKFFEQPIHHLYPTQTRSSEGGIKNGMEREALGYFNLGYPMYMYFLKTYRLAKTVGISNSLYFLTKGIKLNMKEQPLITKEEQLAVSRFMKKRLFNSFKYTV